jgi:hypothetical protein
MKLRTLILLSLLIVVLAGSALAISTKTVNPGDTQDGFTGTAPKKGGNVCVARTIHNAGDIQTFNLYTSNRWYGKAEWVAVNSSTGAPFVVQRVLGSNTAGTVGSSGSLVVNREYTTYKLKTFGTNTSASLTVCQDRQ